MCMCGACATVHITFCVLYIYIKLYIGSRLSHYGEPGGRVTNGRTILRRK